MPRQALSCWLELDSAGVATALPWMQERGVADWSSADDCSSSQPGVCLTLAHAPASSCETAATAWRFAASTSRGYRVRREPSGGGEYLGREALCASARRTVGCWSTLSGMTGAWGSHRSLPVGVSLDPLELPAAACFPRVLLACLRARLSWTACLRLCFAIVVRFFELDAMRVFPLVWSPGDHAGAVVMLRRSVDARLVGW